jgi:hypothetical protein
MGSRWLYLAMIVAANYLRKAVVPEIGAPAFRVVVALVFSGVLFTIITVVYWATPR